MDIFFVRIKFHIEYSKVILVIELNSNRNEKIKWKVKKNLLHPLYLTVTA